MKKGCTTCPYAGHIESKECVFAYTEDAKGCTLYSHEEIEKNAVIELVIRLPKEVYNEAKTSGLPCMYDELVASAVGEGIPLPKGHGNLIDANTMWDIYHSNDYDFYRALDYAPIIIQADEE